MPVADFAPPPRLLAGGGPSTPDARVLRALSTPIIGQFDPAFTDLMDQVMHLARATFLTSNVRCFPVSGLASAGVEALLNSMLEPGDQVAITGSSEFAEPVSDIARRLGGVVAESGRFTVAPHVDPTTGERTPLQQLAARCHAQNSLLIVDATPSLGGLELRTDDWQLDAVVAGVDYCLGAPSGMTLVTYTDALERMMHSPRTSYLDLLQLQAYWSAERLNHHTAPTSLIYALSEALRLVQDEGLEACWERHRQVGLQLTAGLSELGFETRAEPPFCVVRVPDASAMRRQLLDEYGVYVHAGPHNTLRIGLLGADAQPRACRMLLAAVRQVR